MATYEDLIMAIVKMQGKVIGLGIALHLARGIQGLEISEDGVAATYKGDPVDIMGKLIERYRKVERDVAITLAKKAIAPLIEESPELKIPGALSSQ